MINIPRPERQVGACLAPVVLSRMRDGCGDPEDMPTLAELVLALVADQPL